MARERTDDAFLRLWASAVGGQQTSQSDSPPDRMPGLGSKYTRQRRLCSFHRNLLAGTCCDCSSPYGKRSTVLEIS